MENIIQVKCTIGGNSGVTDPWRTNVLSAFWWTQSKSTQVAIVERLRRKTDESKGTRVPLEIATKHSLNLENANGAKAYLSCWRSPESDDNQTSVNGKQEARCAEFWRRYTGRGRPGPEKFRNTTDARKKSVSNIFRNEIFKRALPQVWWSDVAKQICYQELREESQSLITTGEAVDADLSVEESPNGMVGDGCERNVKVAARN
ncbi:hypothetical protein B0H13DRAFT_1862267 [Mycena leptocephala]|nr:hypothetical protein B0H13DRAFT_1862267 [Mycena leptocephala]